MDYGKNVCYLCKIHIAFRRLLKMLEYLNKYINYGTVTYKEDNKQLLLKGRGKPYIVHLISASKEQLFTPIKL